MTLHYNDIMIIMRREPIRAPPNRSNSEAQNSPMTMVIGLKNDFVFQKAIL